MANDLIPMPELGRAIMERFGVPSPGYQYTHRMISRGLLVPERIGGRLFFRQNDLPQIAAVLGIATVPAKEGTLRKVVA
jgi:hypothetical protein